MAPRRKAPKRTTRKPTASANKQEIDAFPSGTYGKYKRATDGSCARDHGVGETNKTNAYKTNNTLDVYERIVRAIAAEPTALSPALLALFPRALEACETAITLRARVALFFPDTAHDASDSHAHFLDRLRSWFQTLKRAYTPPARATSRKTDTPNDEASDAQHDALDFSNYYDVLALPDDYFDNESFASAAIANANIRPLTAAERRALFDAAFDDDVHVELACFFMELEELVEGVYRAFYDVKIQQKTLVEATAIAKVAIDGANGVIARLQLAYPMIRDGVDLMIMMSEFFPFDALASVRDQVLAAWTPNPNKSAPPQYQYMRGSILWDVLWAARGLRKFANSVTPGMEDPVVIYEGLYGDTYNEETTAHYMVPDLFVMQSFLAQQLPLLHNMVVDNRFRNYAFDPQCFRQWYLGAFIKYFETGVVSLETVFLAICWVRSISALQGNVGLGRTISLSISHRWDLEDRLNAAIIKGNMEQTDPTFHAELEKVLDDMQESEEHITVTRAHPILAGCTMLDHHMSYLFMGSHATVMTGRFRAFCHIYSALRDRQLLETIPLMEDIIQVYERGVFMPSRAAATQGAFLRTFLASSNLKDGAIDALLNRRGTPVNKVTTRSRENYHFTNMSRLFRLLAGKDYAVLPTEVANATAWTPLLKAVGFLAKEELFETRVLSRDMLRFSDDLTDVFHQLIDRLDRRDAFDDMVAEMDRKLPLYVRKSRASMDAIVNPLLPLLDTITLDGTAVMTPDTAGLLRIDPSRPDAMARGQAMTDFMSDSLVGFCRRAADVIAARFGGLSAAHVERTYFTLPSTPNWVDLAFGAAPFRIDLPRKDTTLATFETLMKMMEESPGPLASDQLATLKQHVVDDPSLVSMVVPGPNVELCSLLHHAAAGRVRDRRLVEWLIQMGALHRQPSHFHNPPEMGQTRWVGLHNDQLCDYMAVHSAVKAGLPDMVRLILGADLFRDINKVTYQTKDTLAHIAVRVNDRGVLSLVMRMGENAAGKYVHDLTTNPKWKRELLTSVVEQRRQDELIQEFKRERAKGFEIQHDRVEQAERLMERLERERDVAAGEEVEEIKPVKKQLVTTAEAATPDTTTSQKKKKNKKKKKNNPLNEIRADDDITETALQLMEELSMSKKVTTSVEAAEGDRIDQLASLLDQLKEGSGLTPSKREATAAKALEIVDAIKSKVFYVAQSNNLQDFSGAAVLRDANDASRALFLLSKYHRQLPPSPTVPRTQLWQLESPMPYPSTALETLQQRAGPALDFTDFLSFLALTTTLFAAYRRTSQAKELFDLLERRLLKLNQRVLLFREFVSTLVDGRENADIAPTLTAPELAWYASDHGITTAETLAALDMLHGCRVFRRIGPLTDDLSTSFTAFTRAVGTETKRVDAVVAYVDKCVVVGATTSDTVDAAVAVVETLAKRHKVRLPQSANATTLTLKGFEFSATGIVHK